MGRATGLRDCKMLGRMIARRQPRLTIALLATGLLAVGAVDGWAEDRSVEADILSAIPFRNASSATVTFLESHCFDCHADGEVSGGFSIDRMIDEPLVDHVASWEHVVRKLTARQMPPVGESRPNDADYRSVLNTLVLALDAFARATPRPGHVPSMRRLNQTEYKNAIRDLLSLDVDVRELLPRDESSHGFDNITVTNLSPVLMDRYVLAAQKISRLAIGKRTEPAAEKLYRVPADVTQDAHQPGTPVGTRGGLAIKHNFPQAGQYEIQVWLMRDRNDEVESLRGKHQLEVAFNRKRLKLFEIARPPRGKSDQDVDANLTVTVDVPAGPQDVTVAFLPNGNSLLESTRQPLNVHYNFYRHPRIGPAVFQVSIRGPFEGRTGDATPSRQKIFSSYPKSESDEIACAEKTLKRLMRHAYRREVLDTDLATPMRLYHQGYDVGGFEAGIERALGAILVSPHFLFRIERQPEGPRTNDPDDDPKNSPYTITQYELASRLSFFLWSSLPDDELLDRAANGLLQEPAVLANQVRRMLADDRAHAIVENFASQWLYLRNLDSVKPDMRLFPDFDDNLRQALRSETELFLGEILQNDRSILELLKSDYTYLNERLAKHYGIPHVYGSRYRRVKLDPQSHRGGILRHGSVLSVTSYATRTSPVIRGNWVLENILGSPPPPPPPDVPTLQDNTVDSSLSLRARLEQHRADEACASCHNLMDPIGFALENFDAVGRWRDTEAGAPISTAGELADGQRFENIDDLEQALLRRPDWFARTLTEKLMTFALGRGLEYHDAPVVRQIVRDAAANDYRFSRIVLGIVQSVPFQQRAREPVAETHESAQETRSQ